MDVERVFEHVHGHLGWLATAMLYHPAIVLKNRARRAHLAVALSTAGTTLGAALGMWLYVGYRTRVKQGIFLESPAVGLVFERKEHLAFGAVLLAWAGCAAYFAARRAEPDLETTLRTLAFRAFVASALLSTLVAVLGTVVAIFKSF